MPALIGSGGRDAGATARARVSTSVAVACAMVVLLGGCAARALRSAASVRTTTATAAQPLSLGAVSCSSSSACTAVGYAGSRWEPVAERWNGSSWSAQRIPTPVHPDLLSVSCPALTLCFAVGYSTVYGADSALKNFVPVVERWAGGSWSMQGTPRIPAPTLHDVSCDSPDACTAVGYSGLPSSNGAQPLVERWDGTRWSIQRTAGPADVVSCPSTTGCIAVGIGLSGFPVAERWNGSRWSRQRIPLANAQSNGLKISDLSCSSMSACTVVGSWAACAGGSAACPVHELAWVLNRSRWSVHSVSDGGYDAVSCVSANWCVGAAPRQLGLWNGKRWSTKFKLRGRGQLVDVSCTSVRACMAVSDAGNVAEQWNGRRWNRVAPPASTPANS